MSKILFQGKILLLSAADTGADSKWDVEFEFSDSEGKFLATDVSVGDIAVIDTGGWEPGTITRYIVTSIASSTFSTVSCTLQYDPSNDNDDPALDLSVAIGVPGFIARPSPNYSLIPVVSADTQLLPDRFGDYIQNYNFVSIVDNITGGAGADQVLTSATPTPVAIGGVDAGTTFNNVPVEVVLQTLLYPYQSPTFASFGLSGQSTPIEVGASVAGGSRLFAWSTLHSSNVVSQSISIVDVTNNNALLASGLSNDSSELITISPITKTTATNHVWQVRGNNTKGIQFVKEYAVEWQFKRCFGEQTAPTLTEPEVEALRVTQLATSFVGSYSFSSGGYKWIAYPSAFGLASSFKDTSTNLDVPFQPAVVMSITNSYGITANYNVHRTVNILGASITIQVS